MMIKVSVPNRFQLKTVSRFRTVLMPGQGEVHYRRGEDDRSFRNRRRWEGPLFPDRA